MHFKLDSIQNIIKISRRQKDMIVTEIRNENRKRHGSTEKGKWKNTFKLLNIIIFLFIVVTRKMEKKKIAFRVYARVQGSTTL